MGGISPSENVQSLPLVLQCCEYAGLEDSLDRGIATVNAGQIVFGGEVLSKDNRQYAFDYISNIEKNIKADKTLVDFSI